MKNIILSSVILILTVLGGSAEKSDSNKAQDIIKKVVENYSSLQTYRDTTRAEMVITDDNMDNMLTREFDIYLEKPNKFAVLSKDLNRNREIFSNGEKKWVYIPHLNKYTVDKTPPDLLETLQAQLDSPASMSSEKFILFQFFDPKSDFLQSENLTIKLSGEEIIKDTLNKIISVTGSGTTLKLWIDSERQLITKIEADLKDIVSKRHKNMVTGDIKMRYTEFHNNIQTDIDIKEETFEFSPPEEVSKTDSFFDGKFSEGPDIYAGSNYRNFEFTPHNSDKIKNITDYLDKPLILFFLNPAEDNTEKFLQILEEINEEAGSENLNVIIISENIKDSLIEEVPLEENDNIVLAEDKENEIKDLYRVNTLPTGYLINDLGKITQVYTGYFPGLVKQILRDINLFQPSRKDGITEEDKGVYRLWNISSDISDMIGGEDIKAVTLNGNLITVGARGNIINILKLKQRFDHIKKFDLLKDGNRGYLIYQRGERNLALIDRKGEILWTQNIVPSILDVTLPANSGSSRFFAGTGGKEGVQILNPDGDIISKSSAVVNVTHLSVAGQNQIIALSNDGNLYKLNTDGKLTDKIENKVFVDFLTVIDGKEKLTVISGSDGEHEILKVMDQDNESMWEVILGEPVKSRVYQVKPDPDYDLMAVSTYDGQIYIFDSEGNTVGYLKGKGKKLSIGWLKTDTGKNNLVTGNSPRGISCYELIQ
ncbi:MAG: DUF2092 domain-containing protein [Elusimicrobiota bacterium]